MSLIVTKKARIGAAFIFCSVLLLQITLSFHSTRRAADRAQASPPRSCSGALSHLWETIIRNYLPTNHSTRTNATAVAGVCVERFQAEMQARGGVHHDTSAIGIRIASNTIQLPPDIDFDEHLHGWLQGMLRLLERSLTNCPLPKNHPDLVFVLSTSDWPLVSKTAFPQAIPVLGTTTTPAHWDIPVPGSVLWTWKSHAPSRTWRSRQDVAFFRGSATCASYDDMLQCPRVLAWMHAQQHPCDVDVGITNRVDVAAMAGRAPARAAPIAEHESYRYLLSFDGNSYARRFAEIMGLGSTVLKAVSVHGYEEFFYPLLQEWVHFVPFECTPQSCDIAAVVRELREHADSAEAIAHNMQAFKERYLSPTSLDTYWHVLLLRLLRVRAEQPWASAWDSVIAPAAP
ncbi:MAG: hypothetical protein EOO65_00655 [Methanosarcinales archaeon]|nr:MAG: hypothetical protein EOO65_00655 [Methanosarcinales archaeon]